MRIRKNAATVIYLKMAAILDLDNLYWWYLKIDDFIEFSIQNYHNQKKGKTEFWKKSDASNISDKEGIWNCGHLIMWEFSDKR